MSLAGELLFAADPIVVTVQASRDEQLEPPSVARRRTSCLRGPTITSTTPDTKATKQQARRSSPIAATVRIPAATSRRVALQVHTVSGRTNAPAELSVSVQSAAFAKSRPRQVIVAGRIVEQDKWAKWPTAEAADRSYHIQQFGGKEPKCSTNFASLAESASPG